MFGKKKNRKKAEAEPLTPEETAVEPEEEEAEEAEEADEAEEEEREEAEEEEAEAAPAEKLSRRERKKRKKEEKQTAERLKEAEAKIAELEEKLKVSEKKRHGARFCDLFAFVVLLAAAFLMVAGPILKLIFEKTSTDAAEVLATISTVTQYCLLAAIALPAWYFVYRKSFGWKIAFVIGLAVYIAGSILGLTL